MARAREKLSRPLSRSLDLASSSPQLRPAALSQYSASFRADSVPSLPPASSLPSHNAYGTRQPTHNRAITDHGCVGALLVGWWTRGMGCSGLPNKAPWLLGFRSWGCQGMSNVDLAILLFARRGAEGGGGTKRHKPTQASGSGSSDIFVCCVDSRLIVDAMHINPFTKTRFREN